MKKILILLAVMFLTLVGWKHYTRPLGAKVRIGSKEFTVEVAVTEPQKQKGLGGRASLAADHGMLFVYDHSEDYNFWMRDMQFPLDFVWIKEKTIVDTTQNVPPPVGAQTPAVVKPKIPADKILELNAGSITKYNIQIGDAVVFLDR